MNNLIKKVKNNQKGFTLVELIVVIAILGVLAAVAVPNYMNYLYRSRVNADITTAAEVVKAARVMYISTGVDPTLTAVLAEMDMDGEKALANSGEKEEGYISSVLVNFAGDGATKYSVDVKPGSKAGTYTGQVTVTENEELPVPVKK